MTNHRKTKKFIFVYLLFRTMDMNSDYNALQSMYTDDSVTKFGYAFYLSYFFRNIIELRQRHWFSYIEFWFLPSASH